MKARHTTTLVDYTSVGYYSEKALQEAVAQVGPVSVGIDASHGLQLYTSGVYKESKCSSLQLDHGVLAVGYGTHEGEDYWLVNNLWKSDCGDNEILKIPLLSVHKESFFWKICYCKHFTAAYFLSLQNNYRSF